MKKQLFLTVFFQIFFTLHLNAETSMDEQGEYETMDASTQQEAPKNFYPLKGEVYSVEQHTCPEFAQCLVENSTTVILAFTLQDCDDHLAPVKYKIKNYDPILEIQVAAYAIRGEKSKCKQKKIVYHTLHVSSGAYEKDRVIVNFK